ncbi:hypothetical protein ACROAE_04100 [Shewanella sp. MF05960]|uniref:hypothetical protein n=1 Tax=Shewanella sp. MF05960 TaxID=3434874 RepID=UPI003D7B9650
MKYKVTFIKPLLFLAVYGLAFFSLASEIITGEHGENEIVLTSNSKDLFVFYGDRENCLKFIVKSNIEYLSDPIPELNRYYSENDKSVMFEEFRNHKVFKQCPNVFDKVVEVRRDILSETKRVAKFTGFEPSYDDIAHSNDHYQIYENIDINNDGDDEVVILYGLYFSAWADTYSKVDIKDCSLEVVYENYAPNKILKLENKFYFANYLSKDKHLNEPSISIINGKGSVKNICSIVTKEKMDLWCSQQSNENNRNCQFYLNKMVFQRYK